ncbi:FHA domain-containing protein [bacterium]|nr:FHA domain-containing protein [bacterium]
MAEQQNETLFMKSTQLRVTWPSGETEVIPLGKESIAIGRDISCQLNVPENFSSISRRHLEIRMLGSNYTVLDLASVNGVFVNGTRVNEHKLEDGDVIEIGLADMDQLVRIIFQLGNEDLFRFAGDATFADAQPQELVSVVPESGPYFMVRWPNGRVFYFPASTDSILVGRSPHADLQIPNNFGFVSADHFRVQRQGESFSVTDLESTNGTVLNNQPMAPLEPMPLASHSIIRLGDDRFGVSIGFTFINPEEKGFADGGFLAAAPSMVLERPSEITIGRLEDSDIHLDAPDVSRRHAKITFDGEKFTIQDLNSRNGTYVNNQLVTQAQLKEDDLIRIGNYLLTFQEGQITPYQSSGMRIDVEDLSFDYQHREGKRRVVYNVSFSVLPREFVAIVGGSGAGKTTLLNALIGVRQGVGSVKLNGHNFYEEYEHFRAQLGYVPQNDILHTSLTVEKALEYTAKLRLPASVGKEERDRRIAAVLETVSMNTEIIRGNRISNLSGGQRKRVSIAAELLADPKLIYLDEATSGLDPGLEKKMMHTLRKMADEGRTIMLITHATDNIVQTDHVAFVSQGRLVYFGPSQDALDFFEVEEFADIYEKIQGHGENWREVYEEKEPKYYQQYVKTRLENAKALPQYELPKVRFGLQDFFRQTMILTQRSFKVLTSAPVTLMLMLALLPLTGTLQLIVGAQDILTGNLSILADPVAAAATMQEAYTPFPGLNTFIFVMGLEAVLTGLFVPSNDFVKERSVFLRERMVNLRVMPYLFSKVMVYSSFAVVQVVLYLLIVSIGIDLPKTGLYFPGTVELFITLFLTMMAGITFGFIISAVSKSTEMAIYILTFMLFFQFFFSGTVFDLRGDTFEPMSYMTTTRWSLTALGITVDLPEIVESTILCSEVPVNPMNPASGTEVVCANFPEATEAMMLDYSDGMLVTSWGVLVGMSLLFTLLTGIILNRTRVY